MKLRFSPLRNPDDGNGGGGGTPAPLTEESVKALIATNTAAIEARMKRSEKAMLESIGELLESRIPKAPPPPDGGDKGKGGDETPEMRALKAQLDEQRKVLESMKATSQADKQKLRKTTLHQRVSEELAKVGFTDASRAEKVRKLLLADNVVAFESDDSDDIVFRGPDGDYPLHDGLAQYAKSDDAKLFLPPAPAGGTGESRGRSGPMTIEDRRAEEVRAFALHLTQQ